MVHIVVKATPERDLYCIWSTITDSPIFVGTRAEILDHLTERRRDGIDRGPGDSPEVRIDRADTTGTSAMYGSPFDGAFDDTGFVFEQRGWLPRARLADLLDRYLVNSVNPKTDDLLDPLEED